MTYQVTSAVLGLGLATTILWLIRRDRLHGHHAFWWLLTAFLVVILGIFPRIIDFFALQLGISYPPTLLFVLGMSMILIKVLSIDLHQSQLERKMRRLAQRLALLEAEQMKQPPAQNNETD
ncbi:DUF2304 domain-containing protein [Beggiatoa leptomitoformis]|uniref:DUF2304 family protein n=1 Tax=Beggiatoa leptomitoformis TaxID=288004 RepID=A0A2N9YHA9_9GAMM|nr:DUF2304 domain-containing protein [Beggiatoa leptomitoformis]ALG67951.1 DUF2304 family protein [Beggiatoa leptomitoformis]AUI69775.1 DUF2304 family protein [Beggiatoa leptomitoformis]